MPFSAPSQIFSGNQDQPAFDNTGGHKASHHVIYTRDQPDGEPAVTRYEIAVYLTEQVVQAYTTLAKTTGKPSLYLVENRFSTFEFDLAEGLSYLLGYPSLYQALSDKEGSKLNGGGFVASWGQVVALIERGKTDLLDVYDRAVNMLNQGKDVFLVCRAASQMPALLAGIAGGVIRVSRFDPLSVAEACGRFYGLETFPQSHGDTRWTRHVLPEDFLINSDVRGDPLPEIRGSVLRRLQPHNCDDAKELGQLRGMGEARDWARNWVEDVEEMLSGRSGLRWEDVERGAVLVGGRGMGKTTFARALAKASGMHLIEASMALALATPSERGGAAAYLSDVMNQAKNLSPCLVLMEADGVPVVGLERVFDNFDPENPVFVLVATEDASAIDPGLLRHGRIESILEIPVPTAGVLKEIFADLLQSVGCQLDEQELEALGRMAQGNITTLADAEKIVRQAHRSARRKSRTLSLTDLSECIFNTPGAYRRQRSLTQIEDTAYHEAGHAVMSLLAANEGRDLTYLTVVPRDYANGFAARSLDESGDSITRESLLEEIRMLLGGRAAEEIKNGSDKIGAGCSSDLLKATNFATVMLTQFAFGGRYPLVSRAATVDTDPELRQEVGGLLDAQYQTTLEMLSANWELVAKIAKAVIEAEELTGDEVREIHARFRSGNT